MGANGVARRRARRLTLAGLLWAAALVAVAILAQPGLAPAVQLPSATNALELEHGRLPSDAGGDVRSRRDRRLGRVAADLSGRAPAVHCWSRPDWRRRTAESSHPVLRKLGAWRAYTTADRRSIHLSPEVCSQLAKLLSGAAIRRGSDADAAAWAVGTLAHESWHVVGFPDELSATCIGMQLTETTARLLGRTTHEARFLAVVYAKHWYPWLEARYRTTECRNGGTFDLRPRVDRWP